MGFDIAYILFRYSGPLDCFEIEAHWVAHSLRKNNEQVSDHANTRGMAMGIGLSGYCNTPGVITTSP